MEQAKARDLLSIETRLNVVYAVMMSAFMAFVMSLVMTLLNLGSEHFTVARWMHNYGIAWPIAFTLIFVVGPMIRRLAMKLTNYSG